jgi:phosphomannomutase
MTEIIATVSGIRGIYGDSLTPENIIKYTSAFASFCKKNSKLKKIIVGRDGRLSGKLISDIVINNLMLSGFNVTDIGIAPTPTIQLAVEHSKAAGGISVTASHNPQNWNGLKFLNQDGIFLDEKNINELLIIANSGNFSYENLNEIGNLISEDHWNDFHISKILKLKIFNKNNIWKRKFKVVLDTVNSSGSDIIPKLLNNLGCNVIKLYCDGSGIFPHTPEPLFENLQALSKAVKKNKADIGIAIDPDADRLVLITDKGEPFGEENTIASVINFILRKHSKVNKKHNVTVNMSTTRAVDDIAAKYKAKVFRSPVGEINVVREMIKRRSIAGGEGSGGVIIPEIHYGRDSLAGTAIILQELADLKLSITEYKKTLPQYVIVKTKIENIPDPAIVLQSIRDKYIKDQLIVSTKESDGLKLEFANSWVHMRKSNTEPIIRIISEAENESAALALQSMILKDISELITAIQSEQKGVLN